MSEPPDEYIERSEFWWARYAGTTEPAEVHFRNGEPVEAWFTGSDVPVRFPEFELVALIPPPTKDMSHDDLA